MTKFGITEFTSSLQAKFVTIGKPQYVLTVSTKKRYYSPGEPPLYYLLLSSEAYNNKFNKG